MPRPSRLSEGVLEKIPTDKEAQRDHTLKRLTHQGFPDGLAEDRYCNGTYQAFLQTTREKALHSPIGPDATTTLGQNHGSTTNQR